MKLLTLPARCKMTGYSRTKSLPEIHRNGNTIMAHHGAEAMLVFA
jgi:hypothetical protein